MLVQPSPHLYVYSITRDFGFAPNPFHGYCTLATCKPRIRKSARAGDWVMGIGGTRLGEAQRRCIFLMRVTEKLTFEEYWDDQRFLLKRPVRNGSRVQMLGDNIYHKDQAGAWVQEDSHHSNPDGSVNELNLSRDTGSTDAVLISDYFYYFGDQAISVDLNSIGFKRIRDYIKVDLSKSLSAQMIITAIGKAWGSHKNTVISDPVQFLHSDKRADQNTGKVL